MLISSEKVVPTCMRHSEKGVSKPFLRDLFKSAKAGAALQAHVDESSSEACDSVLDDAWRLRPNLTYAP